MSRCLFLCVACQEEERGKKKREKKKKKKILRSAPSLCYSFLLPVGVNPKKKGGPAKNKKGLSLLLLLPMS